MKYSKFILLLCSLHLLSCSNVSKDEKKAESITGHIILIHCGEQNAPVNPFMFKTLKDTSYLSYKNAVFDKDRDYLFSDYRHGHGYMESLIENINDSTYKHIKRIFTDYLSKETDKNEGYAGSFKIIIHDTKDSLEFDMPRSELSKQYMNIIIDIAQKNNLYKTNEQFSRYLELMK